MKQRGLLKVNFLILKIKIMAGKHNDTVLSWDKILIGIGILMSILENIIYTLFLSISIFIISIIALEVDCFKNLS